MVLLLCAMGCVQQTGQPCLKNPVIVPGESKMKVTAELGQPISWQTNGDHMTAVYKYEDGSESRIVTVTFISVPTWVVETVEYSKDVPPK